MLSVTDKKKLLLFGAGGLAAAGAVAIVTSPLSLGSESSSLFYFIALLLAFVALTVLAFKRRLASLTTWWACMILLQFGIAPLLCDLLDVTPIDTYSVIALEYVILGTLAFWIGTKLLDRSTTEPTFQYDSPAEDNRRIYLALIILVIGCAAKLYMVREGLYMYGSDVDQVEAASQYREWLTIASGFALYAQIILSIEFFCHERTLLIKYAFWAATGANIGFSLISGMKGELLIIPFLIFLIRKLATGKFEWQMVGGLVLLLLLVFPINSYYRAEVQSAGSVTSLEVGKNAMGRAANSVMEGTTGDYFLTSFQSLSDRLNLLPVITFLDQDRDRGNSIEGNERIWMIPFYPFVPRFLWKDKPILDKGRRLSIAMGTTEFSSTAVTPFGDLLMTGGVFALLVGMICVGVAIQAVSNLVAGEFGPKSLFVYCILFSKFYAPENDVVMMGTSLIQATCVALAVAYVVYGGGLFRAGNVAHVMTWRRRDLRFGHRAL